ncbi:MAG: hypothetical protein V9E89_14900 [Ilumatobacteraceae bacterium]
MRARSARARTALTSRIPAMMNIGDTGMGTAGTLALMGPMKKSPARWMGEVQRPEKVLSASVSTPSVSIRNAINTWSIRNSTDAASAPAMARARPGVEALSACSTTAATRNTPTRRACDTLGCSRWQRRGA